jgi:DNA topoisomerase VI subunit A
MSLESPNLKWLGLHMNDITTFGIPSNVYLPLSELDITKTSIWLLFLKIFKKKKKLWNCSLIFIKLLILFILVNLLSRNLPKLIQYEQNYQSYQKFNFYYNRRLQLKFLQQCGFKLELESLSHNGIDTLTSHYLPTKILKQMWIENKN